MTHMARIRTVKPEFWTSEQIAECSPSARLLFIGMWNFCDDAGIHPASLKRLKMEVFPGDLLEQSDIAALVGELIANGLVIEYEAQGKAYWQVTGWKHQKIDRPTCIYPPPPFADDSTNDRRALDEHSPPEGKGTESKGYIPAGRKGPPIRFSEVWGEGVTIARDLAQLIEPNRRLKPKDRELAAKAACIGVGCDLTDRLRGVAEGIQQKAPARPWGYFRKAMIRIVNERFGEGSFDAIWGSVDIPSDVLNPQETAVTQ